MWRCARARKAFTLTELLVVMSLMALMAAFAIAFFPNAASSAREARSAQNLQGWLNIAKQRALRDQKPYGLRLWIRDPDGSVYAPPPWAAGTAYGPFDGVLFGTPPVSYRCTTAHTASAANQPTAANSPWRPTQLVTDCQFIEQPDDYVGSPASLINFAIKQWDSSGATAYTRMDNVKHNGIVYYCLQPHMNPARDPSLPANRPPLGNSWMLHSMVVSFSSLDATNSNPITVNPFPQPPAPFFVPNNRADNNLKYWTIQPNDYLQILGSGLMHRIEVILPNDARNPLTAARLRTTPSKIAVTPPLPDWMIGTTYTMPATGEYRIMRGPRSVGDETLKLPYDTVIDLDTNLLFGSGLPQIDPFGNSNLGTGYVDILFGPSGQVISRGVAGMTINLWVRSPNQEQPTNVFRGDPTLVSIFTRTGLVGAYPPDSTSGNPYSLVK